jgi:hypothetical protein
VTANTAPDSPYAIFLSSLRPKAKGALLNEDTLGEPVLVYTGIKPPAPGTVQAGWGEPGKKGGKSKRTAAAKDGSKDGTKDSSAAGTQDAAPKPKPKKPAPKNAPTAITPAAQQTSQAR